MNKTEQLLRLLAIRRFLIKKPALSSKLSCFDFFRVDRSDALDRRAMAAAALLLKVSEMAAMSETATFQRLEEAALYAVKRLITREAGRAYFVYGVKSAKCVYKLIANLGSAGARAFALSSGFASSDAAAANYFLCGCSSTSAVIGLESATSYKHGDDGAISQLNHAAPDVVFLGGSTYSDRTLQLLAAGDFFVLGAGTRKKAELSVDCLIGVDSSPDTDSLFIEFALDAYLHGIRARIRSRLLSKISLMAYIIKW